MEGLYSYMSEDEREVFMIESLMENKFAHLNCEFDKLMLEHEMNMINIENKVLMESGTSDDLEMLYLAEAEEVKKEGQGIIAKMVAAIKSLFKKIKSFFTGKVDKNNLPDKVNFPEDPDALMKEGKGFLAKVKSGLNNKKSLLALGAFGAAGAVVYSNKDKIAQTYQNLGEYADELAAAADDIERSTANQDMDPEEMKGVKKAINGLRERGQRALRIIKAIPGMGSEDYQDIKDKNEKERLRNAADNIESKASKDALKQRGKIEQLEKRLSEIDSNIEKTQETLKKMKKDSKRENSIAFGIGKSKAAKQKERLAELKAKRKLSPDEQKEYMELRKKYGSLSSNSTDGRVSELEARLNNLQQEKEKLVKKLHARDKLNEKAHSEIDRARNMTKSNEDND